VAAEGVADDRHPGDQPGAEDLPRAISSSSARPRALAPCRVRPPAPRPRSDSRGPRSLPSAAQGLGFLRATAPCARGTRASRRRRRTGSRAGSGVPPATPPPKPRHGLERRHQATRVERDPDRIRGQRPEQRLLPAHVPAAVARAVGEDARRGPARPAPTSRSRQDAPSRQASPSAASEANASSMNPRGRSSPAVSSPIRVHSASPNVAAKRAVASAGGAPGRAPSPDR